MKKLVLALALTAFASTAMASIAGGSHDMRVAPRNGNLSACQYCHAPHLFVPSNLSGAPLWNRNWTGTITVYSSSTLGAVPQLGAGQGNNTKTCLSCHDGVTSPNTVNNGVSSAIANLTGRFNIGVDLRNDHPVGVAYPGTPATDYNATPTSGLTVYTARVECASCHDPHSVGGALNFLRDTTDICADCHIK